MGRGLAQPCSRTANVFVARALLGRVRHRHSAVQANVAHRIPAVGATPSCSQLARVALPLRCTAARHGLTVTEAKPVSASLSRVSAQHCSPVPEYHSQWHVTVSAVAATAARARELAPALTRLWQMCCGQWLAARHCTHPVSLNGKTTSTRTFVIVRSGESTCSGSRPSVSLLCDCPHAAASASESAARPIETGTSCTGYTGGNRAACFVPSPDWCIPARAHTRVGPGVQSYAPRGLGACHGAAVRL